MLAGLERLFDEEVRLDARDTRGFGPLHLAALHGLLRVAQALLREGADPDQRDALNRTPRGDARLRGCRRRTRAAVRRKRAGVDGEVPAGVTAFVIAIPAEAG